MEKQGRKRQASRSDEDELKSARAKTIDEEVDEFFALIRRIRATSKLFGKDSHRSPSFRWEDFAACDDPNPATSAGKLTSGGEGGSKKPSEPSSTNESGEVVDDEDKDDSKQEASEDNGFPACLDLRLGPCGGGDHQDLLRPRGVGSSPSASITSRCGISDRS